MPQAPADTRSLPCLCFKGSMITLTTLELLRFDPERFSQDLAEKIQQAPEFFKHLPMILSLEKFHGDRNKVDLSLLRQLCTDQSIQLVGICTNQINDKLAAEAAGLAVLQPSRQRPSPNSKQTPTPTSEPVATIKTNTPIDPGDKEHEAIHPETPLTDSSNKTDTPNKIIRVPVRSGQQVYAQGGDLIVLAPVSAGAEILADGNIHVYAPLRGRALAGVRGNTEAIIFCQSLEAELISVAGEYKISEDLQETFWKQPTKIMLQNKRLTIENL